MTRSIFALGLACVLLPSAACFELEENEGLGGSGGLINCDNFQLFPGDCVDETNPFAFTTEVDGLAPGAIANVSTLVHDSLDGFVVETSDPNVVDVTVDGETVVLAAVGEGSARITAYAEIGSQILDVLDVSVEPIAAVDFIYVQRGNEALSQLAGLAGSSDVVHLVYRSATGDELVADGVVDVTAGGELSLGGDREPRLSDLMRGLAGGVPGDAHTVSFGAAGTGVLRATGGGVDASLFVRVVDSADALSIDARDQVTVGEAALVFLFADMATGEPVAGVRGAWTVDPASGAELTLQADPASEALFEGSVAGDVRVNVEVDGVVVSADIAVR